MPHCNKAVKPLPFTNYRFLLIISTVIGIFTSGHLAYTHYRVYNDITYRSFCALTQSINCDTVAQSQFSVFYSLPVAVWGLCGYIFIFLLLISVRKNETPDKGLWGFFFLYYTFCSILSILLAYISIQFIESICLFCLLIYFMNWISLFIIFIVFKRYKLKFSDQLKQDINFIAKNKVQYSYILSFLFFSIFTLLFSYPEYWKIDISSRLYHLNSGVTEKGYPWIGAENPQITVIEYTDYQCFACKKSHYALRKLVEEYPDKLRLVHRHFPISSICNPLLTENLHNKSCAFAQIAICAEQQNFFWEVNDYLFFKNNDDNIKKMLTEIGGNYLKLLSCLEMEKSRKRLFEDIQEGIKQGVNATPSFIVYGELFKGRLPLEQIAEELKSNATP